MFLCFCFIFRELGFNFFIYCTYEYIKGKCAWPDRLTALLENFLGKGSIDVKLNVIGGTNTIIGSQALDYAISEPKLKQVSRTLFDIT